MGDELVLVDTTHWIAFFGGGDSSARRAVAVLAAHDRLATCPMVVAEIVRGLAVEAEAAFALDVLRRCRFIEANRRIAERSGLLGRERAVAESEIPTSDLLIAATAMEMRMGVLTSDPHFKKIPGCRVLASKDVLRPRR